MKALDMSALHYRSECGDSTAANTALAQAGRDVGAMSSGVLLGIGWGRTIKLGEKMSNEL